MLDSRSTSDDSVLSALMEKRSELDAHHATLIRQIAKIEADIAHIDGAIDLFYSASRTKKREKSQQMSLIGLLRLKRGEITSLALSIVRAAQKPMTSKEIAHVVCERQGMAQDASLINSLSCVITGALRRLLQTGEVNTVGQTANRALIWRASGQLGVEQ